MQMEGASVVPPQSAENHIEVTKSNTVESTSGSRPPKPSTRNKSSQLYSEVWDHFTRNEDDPNDHRAICNYCDKDYASHKRKNGTSTLWNHLTTCKKNPFRLEDKKQKVLCFQKNRNEAESVGASNLMAVGFSQSACRLACAKMIIIDELPFRFVELEGFRKFCSVACPKFDPPSRITIARDILNLYHEEKNKLKSYFVKNSQRVSLTTDAWTSIQNVHYMVLTAHFIDSDWKIQKRILNFCQIPNHKGETIGKVIEACLKQWGIEKVFTITLDNASSNNGAIIHMKKRLGTWKSAVCDGEFLHVRCSAHILNLVVGDGLKELDLSIAAVRNAVRYVRASPTRLARFKACVKNTCKQDKALVCLDVPTRWNSTYLMLDHALKYVEAFKLLEEEDGFYMQYFLEEDRNGKKPIGPPMSRDWDNCAKFCKFLKTFYDATLKFSASLYVTSNSHFHEVCTVHGKIIKWCSSKDQIMVDMAKKMKIKFDKYWGNIEKHNMLLYVAAILDPRYRMKYITFWLNKLYSEDEVTTIITSIKSCLTKLVNHYAIYEVKVYATENSQATTFSQEKASFDEMDDDDDSFDIESEFDKECDQDKTFESQNEIERYLGERIEESDRKNPNFDVLAWWKVNSSKLPILGAIAHDVFAIQVSTVASESAFSTGGRVLDNFRSSLSPIMVEALICCQNWLRATSLPLDLAPILEELLAYESIESNNSTLTSEVVNLD